jgi:hypothetical protein
MIGDIICDSSTPLTSTFENEFRHRWGQRLAQFDNLSSKYQSQEKLFDQVLVCGNLYAVCKKLENLLRTSGLSEMIKQAHESQFLPKNNLQTEISPLVGEAEEVEVEVEVVKASQEDKPVLEIQTLSMDRPQEINEVTSLEISAVDNDSDDDEALLPGSNDIFTKGKGIEISEQQQQQPPRDQPQSLTNSKSSLLTTKSSKPPQAKSKRNPRSQQQQQKQQQVVRMNSESGNQEKKITDIFHSIAELFPAVQCLLRNLQRSG